MKIILYSLLLAGAVRAAFRVKKVTPKEIRVKEGHPFKVILTTNDWYEVSLTALYPGNHYFMSKQKTVGLILIIFQFPVLYLQK